MEAISSMTAPRLISRVDRGVDVLAAASMVACGIFMLIGYAHPPAVAVILSHLGGIIWAACLILASLAALMGALFRRGQPSRWQFVMYGLELGGWGFTALMVLIFTITNLPTGSPSGTAALLALTLLLTGMFLRRVLAVEAARHGGGGGE